jgi:DNA polymerase V
MSHNILDTFKLFKAQPVKRPNARPLFARAVPAGFPSPADDYIEKDLDLNELVGSDNPAMFYFRVSGESMTGAGIFDGDILSVDKSLEPRHKDIVVAVVNSEITLKRLYKKDKVISLHPENTDFSIIKITPEMEFVVWGVVTNVIRTLRTP